ncbi:MAG: thiamine-phosphate kinase [Caulobacterales bacterium]
MDDAATDEGSEFEIIARLFAPLADPHGARGLVDDAALISGQFVVTVDTIVEGVHFLPTDPIGSVAQKALRVNFSDLAAKGAQPAHYLLALAWPDDRPASQIAEFAAGLALDQAAFGATLLGGDTTATPGPLTITVTAFGRPLGARTPSRTDAQVGDDVWVTGPIGAGLLGLEAARGRAPATLSPNQVEALVAHYRTPRPRIDRAALVAEVAHASMDVSDGLLADAPKIAAASGVHLAIDLDAVPMPPAAADWFAPGPVDRLRLARGGDDYEILFTASQSARARISDAAHLIGVVREGAGLSVLADGRAIPIEASGYVHRLGQKRR